METINKNPVIFTTSALEEVKRLISAGQDEGKMLRVGVKGGGCSGMTYILELDLKTEQDQVF
jgi:iron-sulfur cluster assembly protein